MSAIECNYTEIDRQLKEQFIHGLSNRGMSIEIIRELTKMGDNESITSEQVLAWARRAGAQKGKSTILENLKEMKGLDRIFTRTRVQSQGRMQPQEQNRMPTKQKCRYSGSTHSPRWYPAYGKSVQHVG